MLALDTVQLSRTSLNCLILSSWLSIMVSGPGRQPPECKLLAQASSQESQFLYRLNLKGLQMPLAILLYLPIQTTTSTQGTRSVKETPRKTNTPTLAHLHHFIGQSGKKIKIIEQVAMCSLCYGFDAAVVETIQQDVFFQCTQACEKVFQRWLTATNDPQTSRTWEIIVVKLRECGFSVLAANVDFELL